MSTWINGVSMIIGLATVLFGATVVRTSPAAVAVTVGLGVFMTIAALWSSLAVNPTQDYFMFAVVGLALFLAPTAAGFAHDAAAWSAWLPGAAATVLGVTGYLRGDSLDLTSKLRESASERYHRAFRSQGSHA